MLDLGLINKHLFVAIYQMWNWFWERQESKKLSEENQKWCIASFPSMETHQHQFQ